MTILLRYTLSESEQQYLIQYGYANGMVRENPRKEWTAKEKKQFCKRSLELMINLKLLRE